MSVSDYTYGTVAGVHRRIGWINASRQMFDGETQPTLADVESTLDQVASRIHAALVQAGYPANTYTAVNTASARAALWLRALNEDGAAADLLMTFPMAGDPESGMKNTIAHWKKSFEGGLALIAGNFLDSMGLSRTIALSDQLRSGSYKTEDGETKLPVFTRDVFDYPSSRTLAED